LAGAVTEMGDSPTAAALRDALATALGDPGLQILTWDPRWKAYFERGGRVLASAEFAALEHDPALAVLRVDSDGDPLAILVISRNLMDDPALVEAGVALTRLVVRNERQSLRIEEQLAEVRASRARIVEAADAERRRIERDLHDGLQQRMVALAMQLRAANGDAADLDAALRGGSVELLEILDDVRELARGIHPAVLTEAGLGAAIRAAADRSPVPAEVDLRLAGRGTPAALATVYYVVSEALANVAKHAREATGVWVRADDGDGTLRVVIEDDGPGGADPSGHGLAGLADRIAALDGRFAIEAVDGGGTRIVAEVPVS
jgi:signal transduction histidine kinase